MSDFISTLRAAEDDGATWGASDPAVAATLMGDALEALISDEPFTEHQAHQLGGLLQGLRALADRLDLQAIGKAGT